MKKNVGIVFGTFAPMHVGHLREIIEAKREQDEVIVIVSGYKGDRGDTSKYHLNLERRFRAIRKEFVDDKLIHVLVLNEAGLPKMPNGWNEWFKKLMDLINEEIPNSSLTFYTGEQDYKAEIEKRMDNDSKVVLLNRHINGGFNVSGTMIREDPVNNWNKIIETYRPYFSQNIILSGGSSTGKTELVHDLSKTYGAPYVPEFSRVYQDIKNENTPDDDLTSWDYQQLVIGQYNTMRNAIKSPANKGLVISDTDAVVTDTYAQLWLENDDDKKYIHEMVKRTIQNSNISLIMIVPPINHFINDGYLYEVFSNKAAQEKFYNKLIELYKEFGLMDKVVILDSQHLSEDDKRGYNARYTQAVHIINKKLKIEAGM